eukprot:259029_1
MSFKNRINEMTTTMNLPSGHPKTSIYSGLTMKNQLSDGSEGSDVDIDTNNNDYFENKNEDSEQLKTPKTPILNPDNPSKWDWKSICDWLMSKELKKMIEVFRGKNIDGDILLKLDIDTLWNRYNIRHILRIHNKKNAYKNPIIKRFMRELSKLKLRSMSPLNIEKQTTESDVYEMKRRIREFTDKWDKILWIGWYVENNNIKPSAEILSSELETSISKSYIYLDYYDNIEKFKKKDLYELLIDFNVYDDCIIWWYIIISKLKSYPSPSLWLIFAEIAKLTPHKIAIELLQMYQADLTRFDEEQLHNVTQCIVIGSEYPICTTLRISKFYKDRAEFDIARGDIFNNMAQIYIEAAIDHLKRFQSDHLAAVVLEARSDIDNGLSAMEMALKYELQPFVAKSRIERVITSIMNDWEFLRPKNREDVFEINPVSISLIFKRMFKKEFYLTPLGTFITSMILYFIYLTLFTYLSFDEFEVYDPFTTGEIVWWIGNMGYVIFEIQCCAYEGFSAYFNQTENYFDSFISILFLMCFIIRYYGKEHYNPCAARDDCSQDVLNTVFAILWSAATIALWLRLVVFCVFSRNLGPMVQMIYRMIDDIYTFFAIMIIIFFGFTFALSFLMGDIHSDFENPFRAGLTLFMAALGEFDFDAFDDKRDQLEELGEYHAATGILIWAARLFSIAYLIVASLVLLNILIAMMAKTFDTIHESSTTAIIFSRFRLSVEKSHSPSYMPPPLNVFAIPLFILFHCVEIPFNFFRKCICRKKYKYDLTLLLMPPWLRRRKMEIDDQLIYDNCKKYWKISTNEGDKIGKVIAYNHINMKHLIQFYEDKNSLHKPVAVSVQNKIDKNTEFWLDLFELRDDGMIDFEQFNNIETTQEWIQKAYCDGKYSSRGSQEYWCCAFCRRHVKKSNVSIKRICKELKVSAVEMALIHKVEPIICPHCYRRRYHISRTELLWEIIAIWLFYIIVWCILLIFVFIGMLLFHYSEIKQLCKNIKRRRHNSESFEKKKDRNRVV